MDTVGAPNSNSNANTLKVVGRILIWVGVWVFVIVGAYVGLLAINAYDNTPQAYLLMGAPFMVGALFVGGLGAWFIRLGRRA